ncbi:MAG: HlyD family type I secretion periplasmic adaptor subunit [Paracoccaceae bacterium]
MMKTAPAWPHIAFGFGLVVVLIVGTGVWGLRAQISGAVVASGLITVESNRQVIQHPEGGVVGEILVRDGTTVHAGQILIRLDGTFHRSELSIVQDQLFEIRARAIRLIAERDGAETLNMPIDLSEQAASDAELGELLAGQTRLFETRKAALHRAREQTQKQIDQTHNQIDGTQAQLRALRTQEGLIVTELSDSQTLLDKGLIQAGRVSALQREQARLAGEIGRLEAASAQLHGQIAGLEIELQQRDTARQEEAIATLRDLRAQEIQLTERELSLTETLSRLNIKSPVAGVVHDSQVFALQSVISPAQPILYVVPQDRPLLVEARIEAQHIDQVQLGQDAFLRFTAFDQRRTPEIPAQVIGLSPDVFTDELTGQSFYRAELAPSPDAMSALGNQELIPGMPVEAYIKTADRTPVSYLTKPFTDYFSRAFREG